MDMAGSSGNGMLGKKTLNAHTKANEHFSIEAQPKLKPLPKVDPVIVETSAFEFAAVAKKKHTLKKNGKTTTKFVNLFERDDSGFSDKLLTKLEESEE